MKKTSKTIPELRFPEFDAAWENYKLLNLCSIITKGTTPKRFTKTGIKFVKIECFEENKINPDKCLFIDNETHETDLKRSILQENDILFAIAGATIGKISIITNNILPANTNQALAIIRLNDIKSIHFIFYILKSDLMLRYIQKCISVGAQPNINLKQMGDFVFKSPSLTEQTKIANFLSLVDVRIRKLTEKRTLLEQYKKGIMQKLFSQQLRFKDENGNDFADWETKTLGKIAQFRRGSFPQPYGLRKWYDDENGMPFIQVYDVAENMELKPTTKRRISQEAERQSVFVKKGSLVLTIQGSIGRIALTQYDAYVDRTLLIFQKYLLPIDVHYFKYSVFLLFEIEKTKAPGGTIKTITKEKLTNFKLLVPCLAEQTKIAAFISVVDTRIDLINQQIEENKRYKQGLLQQMLI